MHDYCLVCQLPEWVDVHSPRIGEHRFVSSIDADGETL